MESVNLKKEGNTLSVNAFFCRSEYIAGWIQNKLRYGNPFLTRAKKPVDEDLSKISFVSAVSQGGLTKPDDVILNMVQNMENEFFKIHGKHFTKQANIRLNLISVIKQKYPNIPQDMVNLFARSRIYFRCNYLNKAAQDATIKERIERRKLKAKAIENAKLKAIEKAKEQKGGDEKTLGKQAPTVPLTENRGRTSRKRVANVSVNENAECSNTTTKKKTGNCRANRKKSKHAHADLMNNENVKYSDDIERDKAGRSLKRTSNVPVSSLQIATVGCSDDIKRKMTRKIQKFIK